jgi:hypothetical protein
MTSKPNATASHSITAWFASDTWRPAAGLIQLREARPCIASIALLSTVKPRHAAIARVVLRRVVASAPRRQSSKEDRMTTITSRFVTACVIVGLCVITVLVADRLVAPAGAQMSAVAGAE